MSDWRVAAGTAPRRRRPFIRTPLLGLVAIHVLVGGAMVVWAVNRNANPDPVADDWSRLEPQARCVRALTLGRRENPWPVICRWRRPDDRVLAVSFPPPVGEPPWDRPRIEVYVSPQDEPTRIARAIAHEMGHMVHTREPNFTTEWLRARRLPQDTEASVWAEDYAEVFAALYAPEGDWRAPTPPPTPAELEALRLRFFE
jgi:hypothetical protein